MGLSLSRGEKIEPQALASNGAWPIVFIASSCPTATAWTSISFHGLDQIGEEGAKDKVNNHYLQIFARQSPRLVAGAGEIEQAASHLDQRFAALPPAPQ